jgi:hypothetical protein
MDMTVSAVRPRRATFSVSATTAMTHRDKDDPSGKSSAHRVRLPGFLIDKEIGLGDVVKQAMYSMGVTPCSGCEERAAALNRWVVLGSGPTQKKEQ